MNSVPSNTTGSGSRINNIVNTLWDKTKSQHAASGLTSSFREVRVQKEPREEPLNLSLKRPLGEERCATPELWIKGAK